MKKINETDLVNILKSNNYILSTAESCTGGMIASSIVNVPGASSVFKQGFITYSDEAKHKLLGVKYRTLKKYTAVSSKTAAEMALGCARKSKADISIAVTGVAGPDSEDGKPVGLIYLGCFFKGTVFTKELHLHGTRHEIRIQSAEEAMKLILSVLKKYGE